MASNNIYTFKRLSEDTLLVNEQETSKEELINNYALYNGPVVNSEWFLENTRKHKEWVKSERDLAFLIHLIQIVLSYIL